MTLSEFKAWFEGFTEDLAGPPNKKQWTRIQERVAEITGQAVSYPVYIDRYVRPLQPYWVSPLYGHPYNGATGLLHQGVCSNNQSLNSSAGMAQAIGSGGAQSFNSHDAMTCVGRADARALAA